jgi:cytochrome c oxidase cbb3-type subunit 1
MAAVEWLDSILPVRPFWLVRTLAGISMDIGMSLLVLNLMLTALGRPALKPKAGSYFRPSPTPVRGGAE